MHRTKVLNCYIYVCVCLKNENIQRIFKLNQKFGDTLLAFFKTKLSHFYENKSIIQFNRTKITSRYLFCYSYFSVFQLLQTYQKEKYTVVLDN